MKSKSSWELEIFGSDEIATPSRALPALATDDPLYAFLPGGSKADAQIKRLEDSAMIAQIAGLDENETQKIVATPTVPADTLEIDLQKMLQRVAVVTEKASEHRRGIQRIVSGMRNKLRKFETGDSTDFDEIYERIAGSMEKVLKTALILG